MPLVPCPDCNEQISTLAPACPRCGRPSEQVATPTAAKHPVTVELTDKKYKGPMAVFAGVMLVGVFIWMAGSPPVGISIAIIGILGYIAAQSAAWWDNG